MVQMLMLCGGMATGAVTMVMWQRLHAWRATRRLEWDPY